MRYPGGERPAVHIYKRRTIALNDYRVIAVLRIHGADREYMSVKQKDIAAMTGLQQSKVSKTLDRLTAKGIIRRFRISFRDDVIRLLISPRQNFQENLKNTCPYILDYKIATERIRNGLPNKSKDLYCHAISQPPRENPYSASLRRKDPDTGRTGSSSDRDAESNTWTGQYGTDEKQTDAEQSSKIAISV